MIVLAKKKKNIYISYLRSTVAVSGTRKTCKKLINRNNIFFLFFATKINGKANLGERTKI
jgi:hypothetical protein